MDRVTEDINVRSNLEMSDGAICHGSLILLAYNLQHTHTYSSIGGSGAHGSDM